MRCLSSLGLRSTVLESMVPCTQHRVFHSGWHIFCLLSPRHLNSAGQLWLLLGNEIMGCLQGSWDGKTAVISTWMSTFGSPPQTHVQSSDWEIDMERCIDRERKMDRWRDTDRNWYWDRDRVEDEKESKKSRDRKKQIEVDREGDGKNR